MAAITNISPDAAVLTRSQTTPLAHRALAEAMRMSARGDCASVVMSRLRRAGLNEQEASVARGAIEDQLRLQRSRFRRARSKVFASVAVQLVLLVVMMALDLTASRLVSALILGYLLVRAWVRVCDPQRSTFERSVLVNVAGGNG